MLGKLIKYEWKRTWKVGCLMLFGMFLVTVLGCIVLQTPGVASMFGNSVSSVAQTWIVITSFVATLILYVIMLLASTWGMMIFLGIRFYRSMYTDEGYLSHTLPVTANQLFLSKVFVSGLWYLMICVGIAVSVIALVISMTVGLAGVGELAAFGSASPGNIWDFWIEGLKEMADVYQRETGINVLHYGITTFVTFLAGPFISMITLFGALTIGQLSSKHKGLMGILAYAGIAIVSSMIGSVVQSIFVFNANTMISQRGFSFTVNTAYDINVLTSILIAAVMYGVSYYILNKKLNLD